jgi:polynucleotide 5'-kinase involved in rRNA processing
MATFLSELEEGTDAVYLELDESPNEDSEPVEANIAIIGKSESGRTSFACNIK